MCKKTPHQSNQIRNAYSRSTRGSLFAELAAMSFIFAVVAFISVNAYLMISSLRVNDNACRDACRAAAQEIDQDKAQTAAQAIISTYERRYKGNPLFTAPKLVSVNYVDFGGDHTKGPYAQVQTSFQYNVPIGSFTSGKIGGQKLTFSQTYAFPIITLKS